MVAGSQGLGSHQERTGWPSLTQQWPGVGQPPGLACGGPERDLPRPRLHRSLAVVLAVGRKQGQAALTCCSLSLRRHSWLLIGNWRTGDLW